MTSPNDRPTIFSFPLFPEANRGETSSVQAVKIVYPVRKQKEYRKEKVVIALDRSGSMYYVIHDVTKASIGMIKDLLDKKIDVSFVAYNHQCRWLDIQPHNFETTARAISNIQPNGQTGFAILLTSISSYLDNQQNNIPVTIFVLSDGQETCSSSVEVKGSMDMLKQNLSRREGSSRVVTLGFTNQHDADFLTSLTTLGTHPGFFAYSENSSDLNQTLEIVKKVITTNTVNGTLSVSGLDVKFTLLPSENKKEMEGYTFLNKSEGTYVLTINNESVDVVEPVKIDPEFVEVLEARITYISEMLHASLKQSDGEMARTLQSQLNMTKQDAFKVRDRPRRRKIMKDCLVISKSLDDILSHFAKGSTSRLDNEKLAKITDLAYKGGNWKQATQRKMNIRKDKNTKLFNSIEEKISLAYKSIDFDALEKELDALDAEDTCIYSCLNWFDALKDGDCLGIALDIGRSEGAIHDPTQLTIKSIQPSFITGNSFMDALEYAMGNSFDRKEVHGGFNKWKEGNVICGIARERITGMLPLYFHKEHWKVAKHQMKAILGWMVTLDPMGYAPAQYVNVPFLVMAKASLDQTTNGVRIFRLVADTCQKIYQEWVGIAENVIEVFNNYLDDPLVRTVDKVPHQGIFLCQIFCALRKGDVKFVDKEHVQRFWYAFMEESVRRRLSMKCRDIGDVVDILGFLGIDPAECVGKDVEVELQKLKDKKSELGDRIFCLRKEYPDVFLVDDEIEKNGEKKDQLEVKIEQRYPWEEEGYELTKIAQTYLERTLKAYEWVINSSISGIWKKFMLIPEMKDLMNFDLEEKLEDLPGMDDQLRLLAFVYQTMRQKDNFRRRGAIERQEYVWYLCDQPVRDEWRIKVDKEIDRQRKEAVSEALNRFNKDVQGKEGELFASTRRLIEAVALLKGKYHGGDLRSFWSPLAKRVCPLAKEKLKMLLTGEFEGIPLLCDRFGGREGSVRWQPDQKNSRRFYFNIGLRNGMTPEEWCVEFPETKKYVSSLIGQRLVFDPTKL